MENLPVSTSCTCDYEVIFIQIHHMVVADGMAQWESAAYRKSLVRSLSSPLWLIIHDQHLIRSRFSDLMKDLWWRGCEVFVCAPPILQLALAIYCKGRIYTSDGLMIFPEIYRLTKGIYLVKVSIRL